MVLLTLEVVHWSLKFLVLTDLSFKGLYINEDSHGMYGVRNLEMSIRFSQKSRLSERFHWLEMSQIKAEIILCTNVKMIFHKNVGWQGYQWIP